MKCDFCNEEFTHEPYVIHRSISTSACGQNVTKITFNFCSRTCMIAEKIYALILSLSDGRESIPEGEDLSSAIKDSVMRISGCTTEEYEEGLKKFNECCIGLDKDEMEKYL
jgi:hypothetical protein